MNYKKFAKYFKVQILLKFIFQNWFLQTWGRRLWPKNYLFQLFMIFKNFVKYLKIQIYFPKLVFANMWLEAMAKKLLFISII